MVTLSYVLYDEGSILISQLDEKNAIDNKSRLNKKLKIIKFKP